MTFWQWLKSLFSPPAPPPKPAPVPIPAPIVDLFDALNSARRAHSLPPFLPDPKLDALAQGWAATMDRTGTLTHGDFEGRIAAVYPNRLAAENVAYEPRDAARVVLDWLNSPKHRANLLGDFLFVGCGHSGPYWCADFLAD